MTYLASEDIHATQKMGQHSDPRMTNRYTLAAVDPRLKAEAARLAQMLPPLKQKRRASSRDSLSKP